MPEGHSVHRIALQFARNFVGKRLTVSSPQGRFAADARRIDGATMTSARAVGKQLFLEFDNGLYLRVHLGLYGAWDFAGEISTATDMRPIPKRRRRAPATAAALLERNEILDAAGEDSLTSMGAPRLARWRMSERESPIAEGPDETFPPDPVGQVRCRLLTEEQVADLRGPTACIVQSPEEVQAVVDRLGPDPIDQEPDAEDRFTTTILKKRTPIGLLLMDQAVVSGIGNVFRAELLFRARIDPHTPGRELAEDHVRALWRDWTVLLERAVATGQMLTMDGLTKAQDRKARANRADRYWVYKREGLPCRVCGTNIAMEEMASRKLYWCPVDQG